MAADAVWMLSRCHRAMIWPPASTTHAPSSLSEAVVAGLDSYLLGIIFSSMLPKKSGHRLYLKFSVTLVQIWQQVLACREHLLTIFRAFRSKLSSDFGVFGWGPNHPRIK